MRYIIRSLNRLSLSSKVNLAVLLSTGMALSIAVAVHITIEVVKFRSQLEAEIKQISQVVAANTSAAVAFVDIEAMHENLSSFTLIPQVRIAQIRDSDGYALALYTVNGGEPGAGANQLEQEGSFWIVTPIMVRDEQIGRLELLVDTDGVHQTIRMYLLIALLSLLCSMLPAIATIRYFKPIILKPVNHLQATMDQVTTTQDYDARVDKFVDDEFGQLADQFNTMLDELQRRDARLAAAASEMAAARDYAENANLTKTKFIANMSHELRTPLNAIIGYTEMVIEDLEDTGHDSEISDLNRILVAARHLLGLINDVLDVAKIESGKMEMHAVPTHLPRLFNEAIEAVRPTATQNGSVVFADIGPDVGSANVDPTRFRQCLLNLLSNACKFTPDGVVTLRADIDGTGADAVLRIDVEDTGIGIASDDLETLFAPFIQIDGSMTRQQGGSGLGLAITKDLIAAMGGEISVASEPGEGSCFTISLPLRVCRDKTGADIEPDEDDDLIAVRGTILMIEDSEDSAMLVTRWLEPLGFEVRVASTGSAGIVMARELNPDLIILDIDLPDVTGWGVMEDLLGGVNPMNCPIILLTMEEHRARALAEGAQELLTKPAQKSGLIELVEVYTVREPAQVLLLSSEQRATRIETALSWGAYTLETCIYGRDPIDASTIDGFDAVVIDGAILTKGTRTPIIQRLLESGVEHPILWRPTQRLLGELDIDADLPITIANSPAELVLAIHRLCQRETV